MRTHERLDQGLVAARLPCRCRDAAAGSGCGWSGYRVRQPRARSLLCGLQQGFGSGKSGSLLVRQLRDEAANPGSMQRDGDAVGRDVDPFDQQPRDPRLFGRVELVLHRLEAPRASMISRCSTITSSAGSPSRRTAVIVRATNSGEESSRRAPRARGPRFRRRRQSAPGAGGYGPCGSRRGRCNTCTADRAGAYGSASLRSCSA
jgi:hypothetical protein